MKNRALTSLLSFSMVIVDLLAWAATFYEQEPLVKVVELLGLLGLQVALSLQLARFMLANRHRGSLNVTLISLAAFSAAILTGFVRGAAEAVGMSIAVVLSFRVCSEGIRSSIPR